MDKGYAQFYKKTILSQIKGGILYRAKLLTYKVYSKRLVHFDYPSLWLLGCPAAIETLDVFVDLTFLLECAAFPLTI
jgi:hypothetical protein